MNSFPLVYQPSPLAVWLSLSGLLFLLVGLAHLIPFFTKRDMRTFQSIHARLQPYTNTFRYIWPLGTTPVALVLLAMTFIPGTRTGFLTTLVYFSLAATERMLKMKIKRSRPFEKHQATVMSQPSRPHDPSHPSGDAMRVWFLALVLPAIFGLSWPVTFVTGCLAVLLCFGRLGLGVHYPLDVIGGTGLGLLGAGITMLLWIKP
ncbi:MAG: phosphatase PAP2 family protein [Anaerolineales bacterium]|nr:phosphatase PAP2 family protein [Anaerolineales bacterium]